MKHSTRLYMIAIALAVVQFYTLEGLTSGFLALVCCVTARLCEGAEEWQEQQSRHKD
jgi:hypothetical protein